MALKLIILDRDGVINYDSDQYIKSPLEWRPIPGSLEAIARLHREGYKIIVASNQSGVARGLFSLETLNDIHIKMIAEVRRMGGEIDSIFFCPHGPDDGCNCRKPAPGLYEEIAERLQISLSGVYAIGDSERDLIAARAVFASPVLVLTGKGKKTQQNLDKDFSDVPVFDDLRAFTDALLYDKKIA